MVIWYDLMQQFLRPDDLSGLRIDPLVPRYAAVADDAVTGLFSSQRNALQDLDRFCFGMWTFSCMLLYVWLFFRLYISLCLLPTAPVGLICVLWGSSFLGRPGWATEYNDKALPLMALTQSTLRVRKLKMLKRKDVARLDLLYHAWATIQCNQGWHRFTFMFLTCFPNSSCVLAALEV